MARVAKVFQNQKVVRAYIDEVGLEMWPGAEEFVEILNSVPYSVKGV